MKRERENKEDKYYGDVKEGERHEGEERSREVEKTEGRRSKKTKT